MKRLLLFIPLFITSFLAIAEDNSSDAMKGNLCKAASFYADKNYEAALDEYKGLLEKGYDNFEVNYNLGCSYFKLEKFGEARYFFERALFFRPFDKDLFHNLSVVYNRVLKNPLIGEQAIMSKRMIFFIPKSIVVVLLFILFISSLVFLILFLAVDRRKLFLIFFTVFFTLTLLITIVFFIQYNDYYKRVFVVTSDTANIYPAPDEYETALFSLSEGLSGYVVEELDNFMRIKLKDDSTGWIKKSDVRASR